MTDFKFDPRRTALINIDIREFAACGAARPRDFAAYQHAGDTQHE